jgi:hypothetical protein
MPFFLFFLMIACDNDDFCQIKLILEILVWIVKYQNSNHGWEN